MSDARNEWEEVRTRFQGLGHRLKEQLDAERRQAGETGTDRDVRDALGKLAASVDDAFDALGRAAKDPELRQDVTRAGSALVSALSTSLEQFGDELRRTVDRRRRGGPGGDAPPPGEGPGEGDGPAQA